MQLKLHLSFTPNARSQTVQSARRSVAAEQLGALKRKSDGRREFTDWRIETGLANLGRFETAWNGHVWSFLRLELRGQAMFRAALSISLAVS